MGEETFLGLEFFQEDSEILAGECPLKRRSNLLVVGLKAQQAVFDSASEVESLVSYRRDLERRRKEIFGRLGKPLRHKG